MKGRGWTRSLSVSGHDDRACGKSVIWRDDPEVGGKSDRCGYQESRMTADEPRCRCGQQDVRSGKSDNADPLLPEYGSLMSPRCQESSGKSDICGSPFTSESGSQMSH